MILHYIAYTNKNGLNPQSGMYFEVELYLVDGEHMIQGESYEYKIKAEINNNPDYLVQNDTILLKRTGQETPKCKLNASLVTDNSIAFESG